MQPPIEIVEVLWRDPTIEAGWVEDDHEDELPILRSYGILVSRGPKLIVIAGSYDATERKYGDRTKFPTGCVNNVRTIEVIEDEGQSDDNRESKSKPRFSS